MKQISLSSFVLLILLVLILSCKSDDEETFINDTTSFITIWKSNNIGETDDNQIIFPIYSDGDFSSMWEEVNNPENNGNAFGSDEIFITFQTPGIYRVTIKDDNQHIRGFSFSEYDDNNKIISIEQWGNIQWEDLSNAFINCQNLTYNAIDTPDLSNVTDLSNMFKGATSFNGNIGNWNVSNVSNMEAMFDGATSFNQNLNNWNVANVNECQAFALNSGLDQNNIPNFTNCE